MAPNGDERRRTVVTNGDERRTTTNYGDERRTVTATQKDDHGTEGRPEAQDARKPSADAGKAIISEISEISDISVFSAVILYKFQSLP